MSVTYFKEICLYCLGVLRILGTDVNISHRVRVITQVIHMVVNHQGYSSEKMRNFQ